MVLQQKGGQSAQNLARGLQVVRASACPHTVEASFSSFLFMLFLELGQVTLSWNRKGDALCLCGQKRYTVVVREWRFADSGNRKVLVLTTGTLML